MTAFRQFTMDWRVKAAAFQALDHAPFGSHAYYQLQKRITKTVPRPLSPTSETAARFLEHAEVLREHAPRPLPELRTFEFGAGWDLYGNMVMWCLGVEDQTVYDLNRWLKPDQVNVVMRHLAADPPEGAVRVPTQPVRESGRWELDLAGSYGITYRAPADASATGLAPRSIDAVITTSVLEHVPVPSLPALAREGRRILVDDGVMSHVIDYSDHYAHSDPRINPYNFLRFDDAAWRKYNPGLMFQNRLRHDDHRQIFLASGLEEVTVEATVPVDAETDLASVDLSAQFAHRDPSALAPVRGHFVLRPSAGVL